MVGLGDVSLLGGALPTRFSLFKRDPLALHSQDYETGKGKTYS